MLQFLVTERPVLRWSMGSLRRRQWHWTPVLLPGKSHGLSMEEPGRLQSMGSLRVGHHRATLLSLFTFMHWRRKRQPTPVFLPGESQEQRSLVGCHFLLQCMEVKSESEVAQSCPTLRNPMDCSPPGSPVPGRHWQANRSRCDVALGIVNGAHQLQPNANCKNL